MAGYGDWSECACMGSQGFQWWNIILPTLFLTLPALAAYETLAT